VLERDCQITDYASLAVSAVLIRGCDDCQSTLAGVGTESRRGCFWRVHLPSLPCAGFGKQGWARLPLFASAATGERVTMEWWAPGMRREFCPDVLSGVELFVVSGRLWPQT